MATTRKDKKTEEKVIPAVSVEKKAEAEAIPAKSKGKKAAEQVTFKSDKLNESYTKIKHSSGLTIMLYPMQGYTTSYAVLGTDYGSIDNRFKADGKAVEVPAGIAHFLEHKLFESEGEDAFARYAKTGASANAYTSFDRTCYLFSCSGNFKDSLEILLDFVTNPYFTKETVEKEQGIIGQEIAMYDDNPDWRVFFNLLGALYINNPVKTDIAGTKESIAQISAEHLYDCYSAFYNLSNMVLAVAGDFDADLVLKTADSLLKPASKHDVERVTVNEPQKVSSEKVEIFLPVASPLFQIGCKCIPGDSVQNLQNQLIDEILVEILCGIASPLYRALYDQKLINATFASEIMAGRGFYCIIFSGESREPEKVLKEIKAEIARLKKDGIDPEEYDRCKRAVYGRYIGMFDKVEAVAGLMLQAHFSGAGVYEIIDMLADISLEHVRKRLQGIKPASFAISIVRPPV